MSRSPPTPPIQCQIPKPMYDHWCQISTSLGTAKSQIPRVCPGDVDVSIWSIHNGNEYMTSLKSLHFTSGLHSAFYSGVQSGFCALTDYITTLMIGPKWNFATSNGMNNILPQKLHRLNPRETDFFHNNKPICETAPCKINFLFTRYCFHGKTLNLAFAAQ